MKKILVMLIAIALLAGCSTETIVEKITGTPEEIAAQYILDFQNKDIVALLERYAYSEEMEKAMSETLFNQVYAQLEETYGTWTRTDELQRSTSGMFTIITYQTQWDEKDLNINIVFDPSGLIAGFNYAEVLEEMTVKNDISTLDVSFGSEPFELAGTLTLPAGQGPFPAVVLIHGSGPSDRDEAYLELTPFKDIAEYLADNGIAVLRFDKRTYTYGASIDVETFTAYEESVEDAAFALEYLMAQPEIDSESIYILGHSLGGYLIPKIAEYTPNAAGYIITAGSALPLQDLIVKQYSYIYELDGSISAEEQATLDALIIQQEAITTLKEDSDLPATELMGVSPAYWLYLNNYDHLGEVKNIDKPLLILQGEGDYQVTLDDFALWETATRDMDNVTRITYPLINHFLYEGEGIPSPSQYQSPKHVDENLMDDLIDFINN